MPEVKVETIRAGERRPYSDVVHEYSITSEEPEETVKEYCKNTLYPCRTEASERTSPFQTFYEFFKAAANRYRYRVTEPNCD